MLVLMLLSFEKSELQTFPTKFLDTQYQIYAYALST